MPINIGSIRTSAENNTRAHGGGQGTSNLEIPSITRRASTNKRQRSSQRRGAAKAISPRVQRQAPKVDIQQCCSLQSRDHFVRRLSIGEGHRSLVRNRDIACENTGRKSSDGCSASPEITIYDCRPCVSDTCSTENTECCGGAEIYLCISACENLFNEG